MLYSVQFSLPELEFLDTSSKVTFNIAGLHLAILLFETKQRICKFSMDILWKGIIDEFELNLKYFVITTELRYKHDMYKRILNADPSYIAQHLHFMRGRNLIFDLYWAVHVIV